MVAINGTSNQCWNEVLALCWLKYVAGLATCVGTVLAVLEICKCATSFVLLHTRLSTCGMAQQVVWGVSVQCMQQQEQRATPTC